jgi:RNA polymerase sigma factor (sigma-70 family)
MHYLRNLVGAPSAEEAPDALLLERFAVHGDEAAFEMLVRRFGPLVLAVCGRVLGDEHAAEDAFQATFLVLVRKATSIRRRALLGNWLYGVAYRTAVKARARAARGRDRERQVQQMAPADPVQEAIRRDLGAVIDDEVNRLPAKYRQPLVLCYLEGQTNAEAARRLDCPCGTLFTRLARAREMLRGRLAGRGVTLSAAGLATALAAEAAAVPDALVGSTLRAAAEFAAGSAAAGGASAGAAALAEGVLQSMYINRLKAVAFGVFVVLLVGSGGAALAYHALASGTRAGRELQPPAGGRGTDVAAAGPSSKESKPEGPARAGPAAVLASGTGSSFGCTGGGGFGFGGGAFAGPGVAAAGGGFGGFGSGVAVSCRMALLTQPAVQRDLGLNRDQLRKLTDAQTRQQKSVTRLLGQGPAGALADPDAYRKKWEELHQDAEKAVDDVLTAAQGKRLGEISLQQRGGHALADPEVAEALKLTGEQRDKVQEIEAGAAKEMQQLGARGMESMAQAGLNPAAFQQVSLQLRKKFDDLNQETGKKLLEVLSADQQAKWKELTGKPLKGGSR